MNKNHSVLQKGFTLIEMLIVIAIIAILSSVFLVGLTGFRSGAYDSRRISDLQKAQSYLEVYYNGNRSYPIGGGTWSSLGGPEILNVSSFPDDPLAPSQHYVYCSSADGQEYVLAAKMSKPKAEGAYKGLLTNFPSCTTDAIPDCNTTDSNWFCIKL